MSEILFTIVDGRYRDEFILTLIAIASISLVKVLWDLHFLLVHHRVFKETKMLLYEYEPDE